MITKMKTLKPTKEATARIDAAMKKASAFDTLATFTQALRELYPADRTSPGFTVAYLKTGVFYVSLCRYEGHGGQGKRVVMASQADTLDEAVNMLAARWVSDNAPPDPSSFRKLVAKVRNQGVA